MAVRCRKVVAIAILSAVLLVGILLAKILPATNPAVGAALKSGSTRLGFGVADVDPGAHVFFLTPSFTNVSDEPLRIESVSLRTVSTGLTLIGAKAYEKADFFDAPPVSWGSRFAERGLDPRRKPSYLLGADELAPGETMERFVLVEFRVDSQARPLEAHDLTVFYQQDGRSLSQDFAVDYRVAS